MRGGDFTHAMLVLAADLTQRTVKSELCDIDLPAAAPYETKLLTIAKSQAVEWMQRKSEEIVPRDFRKDPVEYVRRVSRIYRFFANNVRRFVSRHIDDPRRIRQYFSYSGIVRLVMNIATAEYQQALEQELRSELFARGLLVPPEARMNASNRLRIIGVFCLLATTGCAFLIVTPLSVSLFCLVGATIEAALLQASLVIPEFIPLYSELSAVAKQIERTGIRLLLLRGAVAIITWLLRASTFLIATIGTLLFSLMLALIFRPDTWVYFAFIALTLTYTACFHLLVESWRLRNQLIPSKNAERAIKSASKRIAHISPLSTFRTMLVSPEYDETFSELLAVYGIETLLFLA